MHRLARFCQNLARSCKINFFFPTRGKSKLQWICINTMVEFLSCNLFTALVQNYCQNCNYLQIFARLDYTKLVNVCRISLHKAKFVKNYLKNLLVLQKIDDNWKSWFRMSSASFIVVGFFLAFFPDIAQFNYKISKTHRVRDIWNRDQPAWPTSNKQSNLFANICKTRSLDNVRLRIMFWPDFITFLAQLSTNWGRDTRFLEIQMLIKHICCMNSI